MIRNIFVTVTVLFYIGLLLCLQKTLKNIRKYPNRFECEKMKSWQEYRNSKWYWRPGKSYKMGDPPSFFRYRMDTPLAIGIFAYYMISPFIIINLNGHNGSALFYENGFVIILYFITVALASGTAASYIVMCMAMYGNSIAAISKSIHDNIFGNYTNSSYTVWRNGTICMMILFSLLLFLRVGIYYNYGYIEEASTILIRPNIFSNEQIYAIDEENKKRVANGINEIVSVDKNNQINVNSVVSLDPYEPLKDIIMRQIEKNIVNGGGT